MTEPIDQTYTLYDEIALNCSTKGQPAPLTKWLKLNRESWCFFWLLSVAFFFLDGFVDFITLSFPFSRADEIRYAGGEVQFDQRDGRNFCVRFREFGGQNLKEHHDQLQW